MPGHQAGGRSAMDTPAKSGYLYGLKQEYFNALETRRLEQTLEFDDPALANQLFGPRNANLETIATHMGIALDTRGASVTLRGEESAVRSGARLLGQLYDLLLHSQPLHARDIAYACRMARRNPEVDLTAVFQDSAIAVSARRAITPKTLCQRDYIAAMKREEMVFAVGPAGTGKTYLAVATALHFLANRKIKRLVLTRPAVEAGERLGFLPGDLAEKINPYLRPLYDALYDMLEARRVEEMIEERVIEVAPLAFMRGRTLNDAFIILDEAQNTTPEQMKMFLTRLGYGSRAVITGDVTQIDLPPSREPLEERSGLVQAIRILEGTEGLRFIHFTDEDVIRHPLVARIVKAYDRRQNSSQPGIS